MADSITIENKENDLTFELDNLVISGTIPLDDYYTKEQTDSMFDNYYNKQEVDDIISQIEITAGNYTSGSGINISDDNVISIDETVALKTDIPDTSNFVDTETNQTITGAKTFTNLIASSITNGNAVITLPNTDGTLITESDLSNYVTLNTAQTIRGAKTFTSAVRLSSFGIGQYQPTGVSIWSLNHDYLESRNDGRIGYDKSDTSFYFVNLRDIDANYRQQFWFNDVAIKMTGNDLIDALSTVISDNRLYSGQSVICTQNSTDNTYLAGHIYKIGGTSGAYTATDITPTSDTSALETEIDNIVNNITKIANTNGGGFAAGTNSSATLGGAVGQGATTYQGGAVGFQATTRFGAGGAIGCQASANAGGAAGYQADTNEGGAVGSGAVSGNGFSGGYNAKTGTSYSNAVDAIQLGTGTNSTVHSLQIYDDNIYNADTHTLTVDNIELNGTELTTLDDLSGVAVLSSTQQVGVQAGEYIGIMGNSVVSYPNGSKQLPTTMLIPIAAGENITFTPNSTNTSIEISATGVIKFQTTTFGDLFNTLSSLYNSGNHIQSISFNCQYSLNNNRRDITINTDGTISASTGYDYILQSGDYYNFTFNRVDYQNNEIYAYLFLSRDESSGILTLTLTDSTASFSMSRMNVNETNVVLRGNSGKFNQNAQNVTIYYI